MMKKLKFYYFSGFQVQVIQQPMYQQVYTQGQGQSLIMPGNLIHPSMNQQIQVIGTVPGKPGQLFQQNPMQHAMLTAQGKTVQGLVQGQTSFPGYATIPTSNNNQTLVISNLGVLGQNILPATSQQQGKQEMQKVCPLERFMKIFNSKINYLSIFNFFF